MEEEGNNKRLMLAAAICLVILVVYQSWFAPPPPKRPPAVATTAATSSTAVDQAMAGGSLGIGSIPTATAAATPDVPTEFFEFAGEVEGSKDSGAIPFAVRLSNIGGEIDSFTLPSYKERDRDNRKTEEPITLAHPAPATGAAARMGAIDFANGTTFTLPARVAYEVAEKTDSLIRYRYRSPSGVEIEREYQFKRDSFEIEMAVTVRNLSSVPQTHRLRLNTAMQVTDAMLAGDGMFSSFVPPPDHLNALCHAGGDVERVPYPSLEKDGLQRFSEGVRWVAMDRQYFVAAFVPRAENEVECEVSGKDRVALASLVLAAATLPPGDSKRHKFTAYLGVKKPTLLTRVNADLEAALDYTILGMNLAPVCALLLWVLGLFHTWSGSWGVAILGLTLMVKTILFPLNQRSGRSMRAMAALKPQIDTLKEKFPEDRTRQNEEMMKLYKEHNVNPAGGCLPVLIQMPVWFALYRSLWVSTDLYQQSFLWMPDLTARDPYWILPILLVVAMFLQKKMMPSAMDPAQEKIMLYVMPVMFGAMMIALPAGLCFYILVNTVLTILQEHFIKRSIGPVGGSASVQGATA